MGLVRKLFVSRNEKSFLEILSGVELFADLKFNVDALIALSSIMKEVRFSEGDYILKEGEEGTEMYILLKGNAAVFKTTPQGDEYKVAILYGDRHAAFGENGLIESEQRSATIRAETDVECLVLDRKTFENFSQENPRWAMPIYRKIAHSVMKRMRKVNNDMLLLYNALVEEIRGR